MENFKEIAEKCLLCKLRGTFVIQGDKNWHSSYLQRHAIAGNEIPGQYVLGPGVIYNEIGQCVSNEKIRIIDFIPDIMKNFKEIAEKCLAGELSGTFVLRNGDKCISSNFKKDQSLLTSFRYLEHFYYSDCGHCYMSTGRKFKFDIIDFIPDNMQEQIKIDIPEGKVPVMEQTENGVVITWKDSELTYNQIYQAIYRDDKAISSVSNAVKNDTNTRFLAKINVLRKLINIRNYFGKPDSNEYGFYINLLSQAVPNGFPARYASGTVVFAKKEHAEQAIKMLGDELKYLFEPL